MRGGSASSKNKNPGIWGHQLNFTGRSGPKRDQQGDRWVWQAAVHVENPVIIRYLVRYDLLPRGIADRLFNMIDWRAIECTRDLD
jgi:hypothetical protein